MQKIVVSMAMAVLAMIQASGDEIRVMSYNIRFGSASDGVNSWPNRRDFLVETIRKYNPDLLGTQETLAFQRDDLKNALPDHECLAAGRDDGQEKGEMMALYFRHDRFEKLDSGHFWLSESPDKPGSKSWDSSLPRMVTWVKLKDKLHSGVKPIAFFNTHFDHRGPKARAESARLLKSKAELIGKDCRIIISGDFNCGEGSEPYKSLFSASGDTRFVDSFRQSFPARSGNEGTFSGFNANNTAGERIDWIAATPDLKCNQAGIDRTGREGRTASDHFAIFASFQAVAAAGREKKIRVLSYNIYHGEGMDGKFNYERTAAIIKAADPDFVALQEVDKKTMRASGVDQPAELARLTGMHGIFGKQIDYSGGDYGQAILSKYPVKDSNIHWLPGIPERERRIAFEVTVERAGREMKFVTTHLHHQNNTFREQQAAELNRIYADSKVPVILAGDLNAMPESQPIAIFKKAWGFGNTDTSLLTYPADKPVRQIDYVLFRPMGLYRVTQQKVLDEPVASDHRPVLVE
ncbi:MAG: endonuclease/exonuclease/phosphatase family protein, partial [bacterium]